MKFATMELVNVTQTTKKIILEIVSEVGGLSVHPSQKIDYGHKQFSIKLINKYLTKYIFVIFFCVVCQPACGQREVCNNGTCECAQGYETDGSGNCVRRKSQDVLLLMNWNV